MRQSPERVDQIFALIAEGTVLSSETAAELQGHTEASEELIRGLSKKNRELNDLLKVSDKVIDSLREELEKERAKHATGSPTCNTN